MDELEAMKQIESALDGLDEDARARALAWAVQKFGNGATSTVSIGGSIAPTETKEKKKGTNTGKKSKSVLTVDKNINLFPKDKDSAVDFSSKKSPKNAKQKCVVAVYYVRDILDYEQVGTAQIAAFFKAANWLMPKDLPNTISQAGTEGWLDSANSDDIKLTSTGENLVEHQLP